MSCQVGTISGICTCNVDKAQSRKVIAIYCQRWKCPKCRDRKAKRVLARALNGGIVQQAKKEGFRDQYNFKLLTLTCPGQEYRDKTNISQAYQDLQEGYAKLVKALRKRGWFDYLRVVEAQRDGFPHFHVLLAGEGIRRKEILLEIVKLWNGLYGLGFIKINALKHITSIEKAVKYVLKYLFKEPMKLEARKRLYAASKNALAKNQKKTTWSSVVFRMNTSLEYVVEKVLGFTQGQGEYSEDMWEFRYEAIEGVPF